MPNKIWILHLRDMEELQKLPAKTGFLRHGVCCKSAREG